MSNLPMGALNAAVRLSDRYITDRQLPDKAVDLIDEAAAKARIERAPAAVVEDAGEDSQLPVLDITEQDIAALISERIGVPLDQLVEEEVEKLLRLEDRLHERVVGQDRAVGTLADAVRRGRMGPQGCESSYWSVPIHGPDWCREDRVGKSLSRIHV